MSHLNLMAPGDTTNQDPYELAKMTNERAVREGASYDRTSELLAGHNFPSLVPLSHDHPLLTSKAEIFNVEAFLLSKRHTSLPDLRAELRDYLAVLKQELEHIVDVDHTQVIGLRMDLREEKPRLNRMLEPLEKVRADIEVSEIEVIMFESQAEY